MKKLNNTEENKRKLDDAVKYIKELGEEKSSIKRAFEIVVNTILLFFCLVYLFLLFLLPLIPIVLVGILVVLIILII